MLIALIIIAMLALAIFELWLFWTLGEHQDRRGPRSTMGRPRHGPLKPIYRRRAPRVGPADGEPADDGFARLVDLPA